MVQQPTEVGALAPPCWFSTALSVLALSVLANTGRVLEPPQEVITGQSQE